MRDATMRMDTVANNVANANTQGFRSGRVDSQAERTGGVRGVFVEANAASVPDQGAASDTDYAMESVNQLLAKRAFSANLKAIQSQHQADQALIDTVG